MKKLIKILSFTVALLFLVSCNSKPDATDIIGNWYVTQYKWTVMDGSKEEISNLDLNPEFGDFYYAEFWSIGENVITSYLNHSTVGRFIDIEKDYKWENGVITYIGIDTEYTYELNDDDLILYSTEYDDEGAEKRMQEIHLTRYEGELVPDNWLVGPADDEYEPDSLSFTSLELNEIQEHSITANDLDYYGITVVEGHEYFIKVRAKIDLEMNLFTLTVGIDWDDNNDDDLIINDPLMECALLWEATSDGQFILLVQNRDEKVGYYEISIIDLTAEQTSLAKINETYTGNYK